MYRMMCKPCNCMMHVYSKPWSASPIRPLHSTCRAGQSRYASPPSAAACNRPKNRTVSRRAKSWEQTRQVRHPREAVDTAPAAEGLDELGLLGRRDRVREAHAVLHVEVAVRAITLSMRSVHFRVDGEHGSRDRADGAAYVCWALSSGAHCVLRSVPPGLDAVSPYAAACPRQRSVGPGTAG